MLQVLWSTKVLAEARPFLKCCLDQPIASVEDIKAFSNALRIWVGFPSLIAAIELAMLDLLGKAKQKTLTQLIRNHTQLQPPIIRQLFLSYQ